MLVTDPPSSKVRIEYLIIYLGFPKPDSRTQVGLGCVSGIAMLVLASIDLSTRGDGSGVFARVQREGCNLP